MKVYRGPSTTPFTHDSHHLVSTIKPEDLKDAIQNRTRLRFNVSKEVNDRQSVCTMEFENRDVLPMMGGLLARVEQQEASLAKIKKIVQGKDKTDADKIALLLRQLSK